MISSSYSDSSPKPNFGLVEAHGRVYFTPMPTLRDDRRRFFQREGLPLDGGYQDTWFEAGVGPIRYRIRNFPHRADALMRHDLHHVLTGYPTDWRGEVRINAWELGAGIGNHLWGAIIMLSGFFIGIVLVPVDTFRAFVRGRRSTNLYSIPLPIDALSSRSSAQPHRVAPTPSLIVRRSSRG